MIAVLVMAPRAPMVPLEAFALVAAVAVAAVGIGPLASWIASVDVRWRRMLAATALALVLSVGLIRADAVTAHDQSIYYALDCDSWSDWLLCWIIWG